MAAASRGCVLSTVGSWSSALREGGVQMAGDAAEALEGILKRLRTLAMYPCNRNRYSVYGFR